MFRCAEPIDVLWGGYTLAIQPLNSLNRYLRFNGKIILEVKNFDHILLCISIRQISSIVYPESKKKVIWSTVFLGNLPIRMLVKIKKFDFDWSSRKR